MSVVKYSTIGMCVFCERDGVGITNHHLIPVTRHKNKKTQKETTRDERHNVADSCRSCHDQIHAIWSEKELEREWNTIEKIKSSPEMQKFINWIKNKHNDKVAPVTPNPLELDR